MQTTIIKTTQLLLLLLFLGSCSTSNEAFKLLFYKYKISDDCHFMFDGVEYCIYIDYAEIQQQPQALKNYLSKCAMPGKERITELFINYNGKTKTEGFTINPSKKFSMNEHCAGMEPRFDAAGKARPLKLGMHLHKKSLIAALLFKKNIVPEKHTTNAAIDHILALKYLALAVWYPSAFLSHKIVTYDHIVNGEKNDISVELSMLSSNIAASGTLWFNPISFFPQRLDADVSDIMETVYSIKKFEVEYHNYIRIQHYYMPKTCIFKIQTENDENIEVSLSLKDFMPVDPVSKIEGRVKTNRKMKRDEIKYNRKLRRMLRYSKKI
ncbi:MAG TPA: DUF6544 family protein [Prolixibacteraceae bacterium]|nr:DUF6544 family protein [Prolixibacteraceae bacterium]